MDDSNQCTARVPKPTVCGRIVGVMDHEETDVQSCPGADSNTHPERRVFANCFLVGFQLIPIWPEESAFFTVANFLFYRHTAVLHCSL